jgi:hypothetical protein
MSSPTPLQPAAPDRMRAIAVALFAAIAAYLVLRTWGTQPQIMADEWYYSRLSRLQELGDSILPSYLYLWLARGSNACGTRFYDCIHLANVAFMVAAAPFLYAIARQVATRGVALGIALAATLAPLNLYTTYFMPETAYYFGFCVLSWVALTRSHWHPLRWSLALGTVLGLLSLVKVHALFLVPPLVLFMFYARWALSNGGRWMLPALGSVALTLGTAATLKFGIGWLLAGPNGLQLLGSFYQSNANSAGNRTLANTLAPALTSAFGHLMVLSMLIPLPLAVLLHSLLRRPQQAHTGKPELLQVWALLVLGATVCVTFLFTASLVNPGAAPEEGWRLHMRYYSFALPLLWLIAGATLHRRDTPVRPLLRWSIAAIIAIVMVLALVNLPTYAFNPVDGPDIFEFKPDNWPGRTLIAVGLVTLLFWALNKSLAPRLFLYVGLPIALMGGLVSSHDITARFNHIETAADRAGHAVLAHVPAAERGALTVAGDEPVEMIRAQFHIDHKDTELLIVPKDAPISDEEIPAHQKWMLVMRNHPLSATYKPVVATDEFALYRLSVPQSRIGRIDFSKPFDGFVTGTEGVSTLESFGRWSDGKRVVLHLNTVLPRTVRLMIRASSYGDNAGQPFVLRIGEASAPFRVPNHPMKSTIVTLDTDGAQRSIVIEVPHPVSPQEVDGSGDTRKLGIALGEIVVAEPTP